MHNVYGIVLQSARIIHVHRAEMAIYNNLYQDCTVSMHYVLNVMNLITDMCLEREFQHTVSLCLPCKATGGCAQYARPVLSPST